jgi:3-mercaptopyruvate sulfurtransferase SseA
MEISTIGLQPLHFGVFKYYGYKDIKIINGGRKKWLIEDRPITKGIPQKKSWMTKNRELLAESGRVGWTVILILFACC